MALYHKIAEFIMEKIKTEEWKKGQLIPSEKEFCEQFQVSRPTVRAAIAYLANQGYLVTVKGKGTFVSKPKIVEDTTVFFYLIFAHFFPYNYIIATCNDKCKKMNNINNMY